MEMEMEMEIRNMNANMNGMNNMNGTQNRPINKILRPFRKARNAVSAFFDDLLTP